MPLVLQHERAEKDPYLNKAGLNFPFKERAEKDPYLNKAGLNFPFKVSFIVVQT
ncbi:hypothetical protein DEO72_LG9g1351 [Vigna unguiculata]|uniref:Uncharacterized protein n=1 Tax=Vigna unguiculata TaxID=3917 RepID=A0A4D6N1L8_VIGUN|nr:hypothetical protein DEO72_LG9g1351 [Vigna unguiculata]